MIRWHGRFTGGPPNQVDGKVNRLLQSVHFPDLPIYSAQFTRGGTEIVLSGRRKFFYVYDLQSGSIRKVDEIQGRPEKSLEFMYASPDSDMLVRPTSALFWTS